MKNGKENKKAANNEILRLDIKTSGNPVKIILFSFEFSERLNNGLISILAT